MTVPNRDEIKELIARLVFKYAHPDIEWGHLDKSIYRQEIKALEDKCIDVAVAMLNLKQKGTGQGEKMLAIVVGDQAPPKNQFSYEQAKDEQEKWCSIGSDNCLMHMTTPKDGMVWKKVYTEER